MENFKSLMNIEENKSWMQLIVVEDGVDLSDIKAICKSMLVETNEVYMSGDVDRETVKLTALCVKTIDLVFVELVKLMILNNLMKLESE